ncbi:hypothetical protein MKEN_01046100 [Mycena kentingensis (nom. inval.)]|nr:hypothetical protein MKEN_01046100 [Mycena kentingensis (nom. inval.)]
MSAFTAIYPAGHPNPDHGPPDLEHNASAQGTKPEDVPLAKTVEEIIDAARFPPSGNNMQDLGRKRARGSRRELLNSSRRRLGTINKALTKGSWLDVSFFLRSMTIAARGRARNDHPGGTAKYQLILRKHLPISDDEVVICGMSMGYPDWEKIGELSVKQPKRPGEVDDIVRAFQLTNQRFDVGSTVQTAMSSLENLARIRKLGLLEKFHATRNFLHIDTCVVGSAQYTASDGTKLNTRTLYAALRSLIEAHAALGIQLEANAKLYWVRLRRVDLSRIVEFSSEITSLERVLEAQLARGFATQTDLPLWRVQVLPDNTIVFAYHHAIADGMSAMAFHVQLLRALQTGHAEDDSPIVEVPQTLTMLPAVDCAMNVRPSLPLVFRELYNLVVPLSARHWTANPCPKVPDTTTRVRIVSISAAETQKLLIACRAHQATVTGALYVLIACAISQLVERHKFKSIVGLIALSMRPNAGVSNYEICDYPSAVHAPVPTSTEFSWEEASRVARLLKKQKVKGKEVIGLLRLLFGKYRAFFENKFGKKRESAFSLSNLGRWTAEAPDGKWAVERMMFSQCDVVVGGAFNCSVAGEPNGAVNLVFAWGNGIEDGFMEKLVLLFQEEVANLEK